MDSRNPTPTVLPSQGGYSPPAAPPPGPVSDSLAPAAAFRRSLDNVAAAYGVGKLPNQGSGVATAQHRQPLQESTGNAQYHHQPQFFAGYPSNPYYLPLDTSTRSSTPLHLHAKHQHQFGGPLGPPPPPIHTPPAAGTIVPSNDTTVSVYSQQQQLHNAHHARFLAGSRGPSPPLRVPSFARATTAMSLGLGRNRLMDKQVADRHPIWDTTAFRQYREKQSEKDRQKWPEDLEQYFLDGEFILLFLPQNVRPCVVVFYSIRIVQ